MVNITLHVKVSSSDNEKTVVCVLACCRTRRRPSGTVATSVVTDASD